MRRRFGKILNELAYKDPKIILIVGDIGYGIFDDFRKNHPKRFFNLGICEQSIIGFASGTALEGLKPWVYTITPFLIERPFEQIKIDIDENNLPVMLVGQADYPTHGPTHRPLNPEVLVSMLKNTMGYFPRNLMEAEKAMLDGYLMRTPCIISLKKDGLPFL